MRVPDSRAALEESATGPEGPSALQSLQGSSRRDTNNQQKERATSRQNVEIQDKEELSSAKGSPQLGLHTGHVKSPQQSTETSPAALSTDLAHARDTGQHQPDRTA